MCIVLHHYQQVFDVKFDGMLNFFGGGIPFGYLVELFFMISGFLAVKTYKDKGIGCNIASKWLRFYPYAVVATLYTAVLLLGYKTIFAENLLGREYSLPCYVTSLLMVHQGWIVEFAPAVNNPTWYLCVLMWVFIVFYIIECCVRKLKNHQEFLRIGIYSLFVIIGALGFHFNFNIPFLYLTDCRGYTAFFIGACLFIINEKADNKKGFLLGIALIIGTVISVLILRSKLWYICTFLFFPAVVLISVNVNQFGNKFTEYMGNISFEIYLWHIPCFYLLYTIFTTIDISIEHSYLTMACALLFVIIISSLVNITIDKKIHSLIMKITLKKRNEEIV